MRFKLIIVIGIVILSIIGIGIKVNLNKAVLSKPTLIVKHINQWRNFSIENLDMLYDLLSEKYQLVNKQNSDNYDLIIDGPFGKEEIRNKKAIKIFYTAEAIKPVTENYDLAIGFNYDSSHNYIRIPVNYMIDYSGGRSMNVTNSRGKCDLNKPYFACYLVSNGREQYNAVALRDRLFYRLSLYKRVESGGAHLNNRGELVAKDKTKEFLSKCKFIISYENQSFPGYITEKVFQAYDAGSIPIYYSDQEAVKDINKKSIIFAPDFATETDLVEYIKKIDQNDKLYCDIWNERIITDPARNYEAVKDMLRKKLNEVLTDHNI